jgi:uncharacterized membrane protein
VAASSFGQLVIHTAALRPDNRDMPAAILNTSPTVAGMCAAGLALLVIGVLAATHDIAGARGLDKILALSSVCLAVPLAIFGALHLFGPGLVTSLVPPYMPWRAFWVYAVGGALIAASVSIAVRSGVRWSGLLFGIMMFLFVAMIHLPGALARRPYERVIWTIVFREMSFGGAGWIVAGMAMDGWRRQGRHILVTVGQVFVLAAMVVFGIEHFLHPTLLPGVPLVKEMAAWIPGRVLIDYVTGAALLIATGSVLLNKHARTVTTCAGGWLLLMVLVIYVPVMINALSQPGTPIKLEGINYFADTLLFAGCILALASSTQSPRQAGSPRPGYIEPASTM